MLLDINKSSNKKILCIAISILIIASYILIEGFGQFSNAHSFFSGDHSVLSDVSELVHRNDSSYIHSTMIGQYVSRVFIIVAFLFPIIFIAINNLITFKRNGSSFLMSLIPYLRVVFGLIIFYYILTIGTVFSHECFTNYISFGHWFSFFRIICAFFMLGAFVIDWKSLIPKVKVFPSAHPVLFKVTFVLLISIVSCMLVEFQAGSKMNMITVMLLFSISYWVIVQVFFWLITRNVKVGAFVSLFLSYLIGLVNDIVFQFRGNYIMFGDLTVVRTALEVAGNYTYKPGSWFWISLAILIVAVALTVMIRFPKKEKATMKEIMLRAGGALTLCVAVIISFNTGFLYKRINGVGWDYNKNVAYAGYLPYFLSNMNSIQKVTLDDYDTNTVQDRLEKFAADQEHDEESDKHPNIIIIQNEAFSDLSVVYDIKTNQDYMPYIHSMDENTRKGYLNMSITGGPTANTEFEVLMRSTLNFLPTGAVPYTQYVDTDLPSIAQVLKNQPVPYHTTAYHSYYSSGYRRIGVYDHFGFDDAFFEENFRQDYPESDLVRDLLSDSANYRRVEEFYEDFRAGSDAPWFCFNVTIQNHGGYTLDYTPNASDNVYVTNFEASDSINRYLSLIKVSDNAFRELIEYFEQCDEPTIIAMYGDHQPKFDMEANEILNSHPKDPESNSLNHYYVPYIIWANFDIEEEDTLGDMDHPGTLNTISANYLASTVFEIAGIELSDYDRYLLDQHDRIPAITALGVWDSNGNHYGSADAFPDQNEIDVFKMIQYNLIFDNDNRMNDSFV